MSRPVLLDLFAGAGGAGAGYHQAGFDVIGVDIAPQPNYPYKFIQADVMAMNLRRLVKVSGAVAIHASPPCQLYSKLAAYQRQKIAEKYPNLIAPTRAILKDTGLPYVIENVPDAPLKDPNLLCGAMFRRLRVYRHRHFETNFDIGWPEHQPHVARCARNGYLPRAEQFMTITGGKHSQAWQRAAANVMGTPWMTTIVEVCESIPPAYTRHIGSQLLGLVTKAVAA